MQVNMYNVDFGDCFLICGEQENLLVDFGSDNPKCDMAAVANHIKVTSGEKSLSCLISHFHEDHISGFLKGFIKVENVYMPDIVAMNKAMRKLSFLQLQILADIFKWIPIRKKGELIVTLYDLLLKMCDQHTQVHFIQRGSTFTVSRKEYQVLWPDLSTIAVHGRVENRILNMLVKLGLISQEVLKENAPTGKRELPKQFLVGETRSKLPIPVEIIDPLISKMIEGFTTLTNSDQSNRFFDKQQLQATYEKMKTDLSVILNNTLDSTLAVENLQRDLSELCTSMRKQANKNSIVFHDIPHDGMSHILMTGDITPTEFNKLLTNQVPGIPQISPKYNIIKAPHHATSTHFTPRLPQCGIILASNGDPNTNHSSWNKICYQYGAFYQSHKKVEMVCSNRRCDLVDLPRTPNCCTCGKREYSYQGDSVSIVKP